MLPDAPPTDERSGPNTARLMEIGFDLSFIVERLDQPVEQFVTRTKLIASPVRGEAKRKYAAQGQAAGEALSNVDVEAFAYELSQGSRTLRDVYTEKCAESLARMVDGVAEVAA